MQFDSSAVPSHTAWPLTLTCVHSLSSLFFFNDTATTEIYTLSLHDALPIWTAPAPRSRLRRRGWSRSAASAALSTSAWRDRKSTRLNSSHLVISYAVFCLKKKKNTVIYAALDVETRFAPCE